MTETPLVSLGTIQQYNESTQNGFIELDDGEIVYFSKDDLLSADAMPRKGRRVELIREPQDDPDLSFGRAKEIKIIR